MLQHAVLLALLIVSVTMAWIVRRAGFDRAQTISLHAASRGDLYSKYALAMTSAVMLVTAQAFVWLEPEYQLGWVFRLLFGLIAISTLIAIWIPDKAGWRRAWHYSGALGILLITPFIALVVVFASSIGSFTKSVSVVVFLVQSFLIGMFFLLKSERKRFFLYQSIYLASLFLLLLVVTYIG